MLGTIFIIRNLRKAREHAERAVAIAPDDPESHRLLALALSLEGAGPGLDPEPILKHFARAIELAPDSAHRLPESR